MNRKKEKKKGAAVKLYLIIRRKDPIIKIVSKLAMSVLLTFPGLQNA